MAEVEFREIKKVIILEEIKYSSEEELYTALTGGVVPEVPIILLWAEGVVFAHATVPTDLEYTVRKYAEEGIVYWSSVQYAKKEKYEEEKRVGRHIIKLIKVTATPALINVAKALKKRIEESK